MKLLRAVGKFESLEVGEVRRSSVGNNGRVGLDCCYRNMGRRDELAI